MKKQRGFSWKDPPPVPDEGICYRLISTAIEKEQYSGSCYSIYTQGKKPKRIIMIDYLTQNVFHAEESPCGWAIISNTIQKYPGLVELICYQ